MSPNSSVVISTTAATSVAGAFAFLVLADAVFTAVTGGTNLTGFSGVTFPAGSTVFFGGGITSLTLASGTIVVYKAGL